MKRNLWIGIGVVVALAIVLIVTQTKREPKGQPLNNNVDFIQMMILLVLTGSLMALILQARLQNRILRAQLLKDRFEMYWKTYDPVTEGQVAEFKAYPEGYMDREMYNEYYAGNDDAIRKYIYMSLLYEYLAFTFTLRTMKVPDPLGFHWVELYTKGLAPDKEFQHVHQAYRGYYPKFESFIDGIMDGGACVKCF